MHHFCLIIWDVNHNFVIFSKYVTIYILINRIYRLPWLLTAVLLPSSHIPHAYLLYFTVALKAVSDYILAAFSLVILISKIIHIRQYATQQVSIRLSLVK